MLRQHFNSECIAALSKTGYRLCYVSFIQLAQNKKAHIVLPLSFSEILYCLVSAGTTLFNKHALSTFAFPAPNFLLFFQVRHA